MLLDQILIVPRDDAGQKRRFIPCALVGQGRGVAGQLQGGEFIQALADDGLQHVRAEPAGVFARVLLVLFLRVRARADRLRQLDARRLAEAEGLGHDVERIFAGLFHIAVVGQTADLIEVIVAGIGDGLHQVDLAVGAGVGQRPDVALGLEGIIVGVQALVLDDIAGVEAAHIDGGDGRDHLIDRAGREGRERTVEQRAHLVCVKGGVVLIEGRKVVGRVACHGENFTGLAHLHDDRAASGVLALLVPADAVFAQVENDLFQRLLGHSLQRNVDGQLDVVARHRLRHIIAVQNFAGRGNSRFLDAARAVQIRFKRLLHAGLSDECVHGIALLLVFGVFVRVHGCNIAEDMRGIRRVVFAHRAVFDHDARRPAILHRRPQPACSFQGRCHRPSAVLVHSGRK